MKSQPIILARVPRNRLLDYAKAFGVKGDLGLLTVDEIKDLIRSSTTARATPHKWRICLLSEDGD